MPAKPILIHKLTPAQIALVERLAASEAGAPLDGMEYWEVVTWQELDKLGIADMQAQYGRAMIVLTEHGSQVRANGYFSKKPVVRLTQPQIAALRFLADGPRGMNDMPGYMVDVCRRMSLRGWAKWQGDESGSRWLRITSAGREVLTLVDAGSDSAPL